MSHDFDRLRELVSNIDRHSPAHIAQEFSINLANLEETLAAHPQRYAYIGTTYANARIAAEEAEAELDSIASEEFNRLRENEGLAIGHAQEAAKTTDRHKEQQRVVFAKRRRAEVLRHILYALDHQRDMLVQISSRQKAEMNIQ